MQRELNLASMEQNAIEALAELEGMLDRIRFRQRLPRVHGRYDARMAYDTRRHPLTDTGLFVSFEHALHHLNWSWNERHLADGMAKRPSALETNFRPKISVSDASMINIDNIKLIGAGACVASPMYARYVCLWQNKRIRPFESDSAARLVARGLLMHPLFSLSRKLQARFPSVFYPDFTTRKEYCRERREGWRDLRWTLGESLRAAAYWRENYEHDELERVFAVKDAHTFCMQLSIVGQRLSMKHIRMMIDSGCFDLLQDLFAKVPKAWKLISPRDLLLWVCADGRFKDDEAVRLVKMIERKQPGIVAGTVDAFSDTPLWYTLYRYQYGGHVNSCCWCERVPKLERLLRRLGCDAHARNRLGLTWSVVNKELKKLR